jgi:hypothetical protein
LHNIHCAGTERVREMAIAAENYIARVSCPPFHQGGWLLYRSEGAVLDDLDSDLFLASLWLRCGEPARASGYIDRFLKTTAGGGVDVDPYWRCLADLLSIRLREGSSETRASWTGQHGGELARAVEQDLESPERLLARLRFPSCFECDRCGMRAECRYLDVLAYMKRLQECQREAAIDQMSLREVFSMRPGDRVVGV